MLDRAAFFTLAAAKSRTWSTTIQGSRPAIPRTMTNREGMIATQAMVPAITLSKTIIRTSKIGTKMNADRAPERKLEEMSSTSKNKAYRR